MVYTATSFIFNPIIQSPPRRLPAPLLPHVPPKEDDQPLDGAAGAWLVELAGRKAVP
jgi:hypothetical protein